MEKLSHIINQESMQNFKALASTIQPSTKESSHKELMEPRFLKIVKET
jgi:hypothetical protein